MHTSERLTRRSTDYALPTRVTTYYGTRTGDAGRYVFAVSLVGSRVLVTHGDCVPRDACAVVTSNEPSNETHCDVCTGALWLPAVCTLCDRVGTYPATLCDGTPVIDTCAVCQ